MTTSKRIRCGQCVAAMINGVFCHETGCPNSNSRYDAASGEWIEQRKCFDCGCLVDADNPCCQEEQDAADDDAVAYYSDYEQASGTSRLR